MPVKFRLPKAVAENDSVRLDLSKSYPDIDLDLPEGASVWFSIADLSLRLRKNEFTLTVELHIRGQEESVPLIEEEYDLSIWPDCPSCFNADQSTIRMKPNGHGGWYCDVCSFVDG